MAIAIEDCVKAAFPTVEIYRPVEGEPVKIARVPARIDTLNSVAIGNGAFTKSLADYQDLTRGATEMANAYGIITPRLADVTKAKDRIDGLDDLMNVVVSGCMILMASLAKEQPDEKLVMAIPHSLATWQWLAALILAQQNPQEHKIPDEVVLVAPPGLGVDEGFFHKNFGVTTNYVGMIIRQLLSASDIKSMLKQRLQTIDDTVGPFPSAFWHLIRQSFSVERFRPKVSRYIKGDATHDGVKTRLTIVAPIGDPLAPHSEIYRQAKALGIEGQTFAVPGDHSEVVDRPAFLLSHLRRRITA